ncbi:MAG: hypothetical protein IPP77_01585 [Bacteroidetes bacterium]|nr:hypothetical protein [Bacteroidota bacterium]
MEPVTGAIQLSVTGGTASYSYLWSNNATTQNLSGLSSGTYSVTVQDAKSCTATQSVSITQPTAISVSAIANSPSCSRNSQWFS